MSVEPILIRRKNNFNLLKEQHKLGSFDDFPMLRPEVDPQVHVSRNAVDQPFYLRGERDMVLAQFSGASRVAFVSGPVRYFDLVPGDFVYVPAGSCHRLLTTREGIVVRYKAMAPGHEAIFWRCAHCDSEVFRFGLDATSTPAQVGYQAGCIAFNASARACPTCSNVHPPVDLAQFRWERVAHTLQLPDAGNG